MFIYLKQHYVENGLLWDLAPPAGVGVEHRCREYKSQICVAYLMLCVETSDLSD